jgi:hypothetical protein
MFCEYTVSSYCTSCGVFMLSSMEEDRGSHLFRDTAEAFNFAATAPLQRSNIVIDAGACPYGVAHATLSPDGRASTCAARTTNQLVAAFRRLNRPNLYRRCTDTAHRPPTHRRPRGPGVPLPGVHSVASIYPQRSGIPPYGILCFLGKPVPLLAG